MPAPSKPRRRPADFGGGRKYTPRRKVCGFCADKIDNVDYKDLGRLRRYLSERGKIEPRRKTGTCALHQRSLNTALKRARHLALLPYTAEHIRITGMPVREPGGPRGRMPRPAPEGEGVETGSQAEAPGAEVPASEVPASEAQAPEAQAPEAVPDQESPEQTGPSAEAESPSAQGSGEQPEPAGAGS